MQTEGGLAGLSPCHTAAHLAARLLRQAPQLTFNAVLLSGVAVCFFRRAGQQEVDAAEQRQRQGKLVE